MIGEKLNRPLKILKTTFKIIGIVTAIAGSVTLIVISIRLIIDDQPVKNPIPASISRVVDFKLYYPTQLPKGYYVDQTSFTVENNSVVFSYRNKQDVVIYFTEKSNPGSLTTGGYINANMSNARVLTNKYGSAYIGTSLVSAPDPIISYLAGGTWVIINPSTSLSIRDLRNLTGSLTPISQ
ncbi:MAG TPA: hypothetical protein VMR18_01905 [Candidatus Saccharimonadales bacterium]|nr:hypothetical protein [Candidatus Saccharimonadales bacterium]